MVGRGPLLTRFAVRAAYSPGRIFRDNTREDCELENALLTINIGESNKAKEEGKTSYDTDALLDGLTYQQIIELSRKYPAKRLYACR